MSEEDIRHIMDENNRHQDRFVHMQQQKGKFINGMSVDERAREWTRRRCKYSKNSTCCTKRG